MGDMVDFRFFLSYARFDLDRHLRKFYQDLALEVRALAGIETETLSEIGFLDLENIDLGEEWSEKLRLGIHLSRVLVPLYSPTYFKRETCGKEFSAFSDPANVYLGSSLPVNLLRPRPILPILWYPVRKDQLPATAPATTEIQFTKGNFPKVYSERGLQFILSTPGYARDYRIFLRWFAQRLIEVAEAEPKRTLDDLRFVARLRDAKAAFPSAPQSSLEKKRTTLRLAKFVFIAAKAGEIDRIGHAYGQNGSLDWRPCAPQEDEFVAAIAQDAARLEEFISEPQLTYRDLTPILKQALIDRAVVVVLVDAWSLTVPNYRHILLDSQGWNVHSEVLISLNRSDPETARQIGELERLAILDCPNNFLVRLPANPADPRSLSIQLRDEVRVALARAHMRLLRHEVVSLPPTGQSIPTMSNA